MNKYFLDKDSLGKLAEEVFGKDRVWVSQSMELIDVGNPNYGEEDEPEFIKAEDLIIHICVHFPKIKITNSFGHEHTIYDLFTKFIVRNIAPDAEYKCYLDFEGRRTTFSFNEMYSGYIHSHLPRTQYEFKNFCTGNSYYNTLLTDIQMNPTEENWLMLFMGLEKFVSWESIEGGPYKKMCEIMGPNQTVKEDDLKRELRKILPHLPKAVWTYTDGLKLIENHPAIYQVCDRYSEVRKLSNISSKLVKNYVNEWMDNYSERGLKWKEGEKGEKNFPFTILQETPEETPQISKEVVDKYIQIINKQVQKYNQNLSYERAKEDYFSITVAKAGITE